MGLDEVAIPFAEAVPVPVDAPAIDRLVTRCWCGTRLARRPGPSDLDEPLVTERRCERSSSIDSHNDSSAIWLAWARIAAPLEAEVVGHVDAVGDVGLEGSPRVDIDVGGVDIGAVPRRPLPRLLSSPEQVPVQGRLEHRRDRRPAAMPTTPDPVHLDVIGMEVDAVIVVDDEHLGLLLGAGSRPAVPAASPTSAVQNEPGSSLVGSPAMPESRYPRNSTRSTPITSAAASVSAVRRCPQLLAVVEDPVGHLAELAPRRGDEHHAVAGCRAWAMTPAVVMHSSSGWAWKQTRVDIAAQATAGRRPPIRRWPRCPAAKPSGRHRRRSTRRAPRRCAGRRGPAGARSQPVCD